MCSTEDVFSDTVNRFEFPPSANASFRQGKYGGSVPITRMAIVKQTMSEITMMETLAAKAGALTTFSEYD